MKSEGVIKFEAAHAARPVDVRRHAEVLGALAAWRSLFFSQGLIGQDPARYDGAGYGNVSARVPPFPGGRGRRAFIITGTQTGGAPCVDESAFTLVTRYDARKNRVESAGPIRPSSESLTHGAIYDLSPAIRFVFHGHCPAIFRRARDLRLPTTAQNVDYGTPEMAHEVARLFHETALSEGRVLVMGGHEDGVVAFGKDAAEAGSALMKTLARALTVDFTTSGALCATQRPA